MLRNKRKIFNDPVYGLISFKFEILYDLINHAIFQRLRRISQMGLASLVYPGAIHTRFHHALGALHLMTRALDTLKNKGIEISEEESEAVCIAILLHDIGHGPFSHTLEHQILPYHHERISLAIMRMLNDEFDGKLNLAISIFTNKYKKSFLHELVSSQLDMDRLDYLNRDSFYSGVAEGVIGYDRIIQMLNVIDDKLVVEEKGIYSIEKFLMARRIMYWQVYLHKTALCAEQMLGAFIHRLAELKIKDSTCLSANMAHQLITAAQEKQEEIPIEQLNKYCQIDDHDVYYLLKQCQKSEDQILHYWSNAILNRNLHEIKMSDSPFSRDFLTQCRLEVGLNMKITPAQAERLVLTGKEDNLEYKKNQEEIYILARNGNVQPYSSLSKNPLLTSVITKHFLCIPRIKS